MTSPELSAGIYAHETTVTVGDRLAALAANMQPGFNQLPGNEDLEASYLDYRASILDERYADASNYFRFEELTVREQDQARMMVDQLAYEGIASASILNKRLQSVRVLSVATHTTHGKSVGGEFINGLAVVAQQVNSQPRTPAQQNHAKLHEIAHGLEAPNTIVSMGSEVALFGRGIVNPRLARVDDLFILNDATEAIVDTLTASVSDIDKASYFAGRTPDMGYWKEDIALTHLAAMHPVLARGMWEGAFSTGLHDRAVGKAFAAAYAPLMPSDGN